MPKEVMLWNNEETASVRASKIRSFQISKHQHAKDVYSLLGWHDKTDFPSKEFFNFGRFESVEAARNKLINIHYLIETIER